MNDNERLLWASVFANAITETNIKSWDNNRKIVIRKASMLVDEVLEAVSEVVNDLDFEVLGFRKFMEK